MGSKATEITSEQLATVRDEELRYAVHIAWSDEDERFIATVPDLAGCTADGPTHEAAAAAALEAMRIWLYVARQEGWQIPRPAVDAAA